jgi:hypothetical protein
MVGYNYSIMARKTKKMKVVKERNWLAVRAHTRGGAGSHKNRTKAVNRGSSRKAKHKGRNETW